MGCTSSRSTDVVNNNRKMLPSSENPHLVALTSSTYGFLSLDSQKHSEETKEADPVNQMYQQMMNIDAPGTQLPQSWSEVSNVLSKLKTEVQTKDKVTGKTQGKTEAQAIDISELLEDAEEVQLEDEKSSTNNKASKHRRDVSEIHTLEEVDRMASVTEESSSDDDFVDSGGLTQVPKGYYDMKNSRPGENGKRYSMSSVISRSRSNIVESKSSKSISSSNSSQSVALDKHRSGSTLFDPEFLASFQEAFEKLSSGVPSSQRDGGKFSSKGNKIPQQDAGKVAPVQTLKSRNVGSSEVFQLPDSRENASVSPPPKKVGEVAQRIRDLNASVSPPPLKKVGEVPQKTHTPPPKKRLEDPFVKFEKRCPPDGEHKVVFYSTSLRGIRKTFEDCNTVRSIIQSFNVEFDERDVSLDSTFRQELKDIMEKPVPVPRLFVKGRYLGGSEEVIRLHENGTLAKLLDGIPSGNLSKDCDGCGGVRFIPCTDCNGSRKVVDKTGTIVKCPDCNENGLARCPICS